MRGESKPTAVRHGRAPAIVLQSIQWMTCCLAASLLTNQGAAARAASRGQCGLEWVEGVGSPGLNGEVFALGVFDDGGGPALYAGGTFTTAGGVSAAGVARWNGVAWTPVTSGTNDDVLTMRLFDPPGPAQGLGLYIGGRFTLAGGASALRIARWDGMNWAALGTGADNTVNTIAIHDDGLGDGPALYACGLFTQMGGVLNTRRVARWNGTTWSPLGTGLDDVADVVHSFDEDGNGPNPPRLFAGGEFLNAGGVPAQYVARWDGASWSNVGGVAPLNEHLHTMFAFDDGMGGGPALYVGGHFTHVAGQFAGHIARWNGTSWSPVGGGFGTEVFTMTAFDDGTGGGPQLYAGGYVFVPRAGPAAHVAKWTGTQWIPLGSGTDDSIWALTTFDDGAGLGTALYAGGAFSTAGGLVSNRMAQWIGVQAGPPCRDLDADGDVDLADHTAHQACLTGPGGGVLSGCDAADCDLDLDVDLSEFARLQEEFTGPCS